MPGQQAMNKCSKGQNLFMNDTKLWKIFSEYIRLRDSDENGYCVCFTCPAVRYWKNMDCGHGHGRQHMTTKYSEKNNHAQCKRCNGFEGGKRERYKEAMNKKYGPGTWEMLELQTRMKSKLGPFEINTMAFYYAQEVKKLKAKKTLKE